MIGCDDSFIWVQKFDSLGNQNGNKGRVKEYKINSTEISRCLSNTLRLKRTTSPDSILLTASSAGQTFFSRQSIFLDDPGGWLRDLLSVLLF